jgi:hypothetical protein
MRSLVAGLVLVVASSAFAQRDSDPPLKKKESLAPPVAEPLSRSTSSPAAPNVKWVEPRHVEQMAHEKRVEMIRTLEQLIALERR